MPDITIEDVADTAFMVAMERAMEGDRSDALFHDPLSAKLAGERGRRIVESLGKHAGVSTWTLAMRTCIIDAYIHESLAQGVTQIVNLGAGLDTRPYRMDLPASLQWVEVDIPKIIDLKESVLVTETPRCRLERIRLDLAHRPARARLFADLNARAPKTLIITEGVVPYLTNDQVGSLADDLRAQEHFALWIVDYFSPLTFKYRQRRVIKERMVNAPWRFEPPDWFGFFGEHHWKLKEIRYLFEEGQRRGRRPPLALPIRIFMLLRSLFVSRKRRAKLKQFAGYAVLERD
jgi:methyltransferase (TIGR00027 family)